MNRLRWLGCGLVSALVFTVQAQSVGRELTPSDFAYGRDVVLPDDPPALIALEVPIELYRKTASPDLLDVWVFNAAGEQVPHALQRVVAPAPATLSAVTVPIFPIARALAAQPLGLAITIVRGTDGQVLSLQSTKPAPAEGEIGAYVLDLRALTQPALAARLVWRDAPDNLLLPLSLETSADLVTWSALPATGGLLHLEHAGQRIQRDRLEWSATRAPFLRIRPAQQAAFPVLLESAAIELAPSAPAPQLTRVAALALPAADGGIYHFDLAGPVPVDELELELPEDNSVIAGELLGAEHSEGPYRRVAEARFYRLTVQGQPLFGPRLRDLQQRVRYYELRVDPTHTGLGAGRPTLATYHVPAQLLFLRRGAGPFTVAYGRYGVQRQRFEAAELLALAAAAGQSAAPAHAQLSAARALAGEGVLMAPPAAPPYRTYALWAALIVGAGLLLWLAYQLARGAI